MKKKILLVFGTRPEAIKMAPLVKELQKYPEQFHVNVCVTAQHREMLDQVLRLFEIIPEQDLNIMKTGQDLYEITSRVLLGMRDVLKEVRPDVVLVHGDTTTSTAAALAAFYQQIPVGHIEAGLRTHNIYSPWPEEMNRQISGRIATWHFAPTQLSRQNLIAEGVKRKNIHVTGNTVIDALYWVIEKMKQDKDLDEKITRQLIGSGLLPERLESWKTQSANGVGRELGQSLVTPRKLVLITGHRRENFGQGFIHICQAIKELAALHRDVDFVYPMHLNPNVRKPIAEIFGKAVLSNVCFIEPLDYLPFIFLMSLSYLVLTDSGGIQEEAPGLGKPVLVMRDTTERPEALQAGTVKLVGTDRSAIIREVSALVRDPNIYQRMAQANNPYGDGKACPRIAEVLRF